MPLRIGDAVWLRSGEKDDPEPFTAGTITNVQQGGGRLTIQWSTGKEVVVNTATSDVFSANEQGATSPDHCGLLHLNEPTVLENTRARFAAKDIYTYTGKILIALNPFSALPIYTEQIMSNYVDADIGSKGNAPHVYAMGEAAFKFVRRQKSAASIIMSGESGSGKTETTKHVMRYLAWRSESLNAKNKAQAKMSSLADAILKTDPLLEAFGNAKTVRNNNSSRFGKMMRLHFEPTGAVAGASIKTYLLEKSRSVAISDPERNYHIFYLLMAGADKALMGSKAGGMKPEDFRMLSQSKCLELPGRSDKTAWVTLVDSMDTLAISADEQAHLASLLTALLLLGNVSFEENDDEKALVAKDAADTLKSVEELLQSGGLAGNLTSKKFTRGARGSVMMVDFNKQQADMARDALIKSIYAYLFDWVVDKVNAFIIGSDEAAKLPYVGLLDIFGFENFTYNSFEQLCINYANEKLQQFFLLQVFKTEEELHVKEGVPWPDPEYQDNTPCIELLEKPPSGILRLLDSQCKTPNASEATFCKELNRVHGKGNFLVAPRIARLRDDECFIVRHYAGDVVYHSSLVVSGASGRAEVPWLEKNNDTLQEDWLNQLSKSGNALLKAIFTPLAESAAKNKKTSSFSSVGRRFVNDLNALLLELKNSKSHFIRCIKPNKQQKPAIFSSAMVLDQLRCSGVVEAVKVMQQAFATRIPYEDVYGRYAKLMGPEVVKEAGDDPAAFCETIALACEVATTDYALGVSKLFLKAGCGSFLEDLASMDVSVVVPLLIEKIAQSKRKKGAAKLIGAQVLGWSTRKKFLEKKNAAMVQQHRFRTIKARREYHVWAEARKARLKKEAEERARKEAEEQARRAAEEKVRKQQEEERKRQEIELAKMEAKEAERKRAEQEAAMAAEMEKAKADAEQAVRAAAAEQARIAEAKAAEDAERNREKQGKQRLTFRPSLSQRLDRLRQEHENRPVDDEEKARAARFSQVGAGAKRMSTAEQDTYSKAVRKSIRHSSVGDGDQSPAVKATREASSLNAALAAAEGAVGFEEGLGARTDKIKPQTAVSEEEFFQVTIKRDSPGGTLGVAIDRWGGEVTVGSVTTDGPVDREGTLVQGDVICGVDGVACDSIEEVTALVMEPTTEVTLHICRRPVVTVIETELKMQMGLAWEPFVFRLLSNRNIEFEKLSPPAYTGEISVRLAHAVNLKEDNGDQMLEIVTGAKPLRIKASMEDICMWQLRLQEIIMLADKVSNVAHGWLLMEVGAKQFSHYWFVLFSNGNLMYFSDPESAVLGQALGFVPVEQCTESSPSKNRHFIHIKCSWTSWLLATESKENMLRWSASLHAATPTQGSNKQALDVVLAQGWVELPKEVDVDESPDGEVWVRHWYVCKSVSALNLYTEQQKKDGNLSEPAISFPVSEMASMARSSGLDFYKWGMVLEMRDGTQQRMRAVGQSEMKQLLSTLNVNCIAAPSSSESAEVKIPKERKVLKAGWLGKKAEARGLTGGHAFQNRWFVLDVVSEGGAEEATVVRTATLSYFHSKADSEKDSKDGTQIPLWEAMGVKGSLSKTKGTEHRITVRTAKREFELGSPDEATAKEWVELLQAWIGLPKVERIFAGDGKAAGVIKAGWMEVKILASRPNQASLGGDEVGRFQSSFASSRPSKPKKREISKLSTASASTIGEDEDRGTFADDQLKALSLGEDEEDEEEFIWAYVVFLSDGTLRRYADEERTSELGHLVLGYLAQVSLYQEDPDYEHAFHIQPESASSDTWICCPPEPEDTPRWISVLKA